MKAAKMIFAAHETHDLATVETNLDRIRELKTEAGSAGDDAQVALCDAALGGDASAYEACIAALV